MTAVNRVIDVNNVIFDGKHYRSVPVTPKEPHCQGCAFYRKGALSCQPFLDFSRETGCVPRRRGDGKNVQWTEVRYKPAPPAVDRRSQLEIDTANTILG